MGEQKRLRKIKQNRDFLEVKKQREIERRNKKREKAKRREGWLK